MISLSYNSESLEYDAYALLTSFYPGTETRQSASEEAPGVADGLHLNADAEGRVRLVFSAGESFPEDKEYLYTPEKDAEPGSHEWKWAVKCFIYDALADYSGRNLPWGGLTGVRPTKLILNSARERGLDEEGLVAYMRRQYRVSEEKARLGYRIAMLEDSILTPFQQGGYSVYIGIPFCPSTCLYCSFLSYPITLHQKEVRSYLDCIEKELKASAEIMAEERLDTVYIGGGTPTALSAEELERLLAMVVKYLPMEQVKEFTVEAGRPDSLDAEKFRVMKAHGVDRISVNPQTFKEETLRLIGRRQTTQQLLEAYALAREEGFDNINMDLILGLPGETLSDVEETLRRVKELAPDSLTVHSLAIKRASKMRDWVAEHGAISGLDYERAMKTAQETAAALGMQPYYLYRQKNMAGALENTGFAREGKYGLYNIVIMEEVQSIYAIGAGTVSKRVFVEGSEAEALKQLKASTGAHDRRPGAVIERCDTHKDLSLYLSDIQAMIGRKRRLFGNEE